MFANVFTSSLRASSRMAPRLIPRAAPRAAKFSTTIVRREAAAKKEFDNEVHRGFEEIPFFVKRIPVDVYPLVVLVSFVSVLGIVIGVKTLWTDDQLRLKPEYAYDHDDCPKEHPHEHKST